MPQAFHPSIVPLSQGATRSAHRSDSCLSNPSPRRPEKRHTSRPRVPSEDMLSDTFDNPLSRQRKRWFATEMRKKSSMYTREKPLKLFAGTWNVNGRAPQSEAEFEKWLFPNEHSRDPFDVYMLGLQEIQSLSGVDAVRSDVKRGEEWLQKMKDVLGSDFELIANRQLVGILVMVFLRKNHTPYLSDVQLSYAGTGFLNAMGNKGGVAARFQLYDRTVSCVACHLAAHTEFVERRNQDFRDVVRKAVFLPVRQPDQSLSASEMQTPQNSDTDDIFGSGGQMTRAESATPFGQSAANGPGAWLGSVAAVAAAFSDMSAGANTAVLNDPNALKILEHDAVFWLGDLNYRIDASLADVVRWIEQHDWQKLYAADQLQRQMKTCNAFRGFQEGPIRFAPTYKLHRSGKGYRTGENGEPTRVPAYTDRILWRLGENLKGREGMSKPVVKQLEYNSALVQSSDHRPVFASFQMMFAVEDIARKADVEQKVNRELDQREASLRPSLQFSTSVDFGDLFFEQRCSRNVAIRNSGTFTAFVSASLPSNLPKWFIFDPSTCQNVEVPPGKSIQLQFGVFITGENGTANDISRRGCALSTSVKIVGEPGGLREHIRIRGRYVATTLGLSLETLSMLERPVLALRDPDNIATVLFSGTDREEYDHDSETAVVPRSVPKELWLLVQALLCPLEDERESLAESTPELFLHDGEEVDMQRVLSFVDRGENIPRDVDGHAVASCMLLVLKNLEDSVVPQALQRRVMEAGYAEDADAVQNVLDMLPPLNSNVFWYVVGFLCKCVVRSGSGDNGSKVAEVFGEALLPRRGARPGRQERSRTAFMTEVFRIHEEERNPRYRAIFDLS